MAFHHFGIPSPLLWPILLSASQCPPPCCFVVESIRAVVNGTRTIQSVCPFMAFPRQQFCDPIFGEDKTLGITKWHLLLPGMEKFDGEEIGEGWLANVGISAICIIPLPPYLPRPVIPSFPQQPKCRIQVGNQRQQLFAKKGARNPSQLPWSQLVGWSNCNSFTAIAKRCCPFGRPLPGGFVKRLSTFLFACQLPTGHSFTSSISNRPSILFAAALPCGCPPSP